MSGRFYAPQTIERIASDVLGRYQQRAGRGLAPPISAEYVLDVVYADELGPPLWDAIPEPAGRTVLAGLAPAQRLIVLNETRRQLITTTDGLYNTLLAHEVGHWELHVDRARIGQSTLPGVGHELRFACTRDDASSWDERNAHRFMGCLLLPRALLAPRAAASTLSSWPALYRLREEFDVTITTLCVRLDELGLLYVDRDGSLHRSRREAHGQLRLL